MLDLSLPKHTLPFAAVSRLQTDFLLLKELRFVLFCIFCLVFFMFVCCFFARCLFLFFIDYSCGSVKITSS